MSSSPAWLTVALTTLSTDNSNPSQVLHSGIRSLPSSHVLHHLNRWARHVWRPAVNASALFAFIKSPDKESLSGLGASALSLLTALIETVRRCEAEQWVEVLGIMFLAGDPWAVEVGKEGNEKEVEKAVQAILWMFESEELVKEVTAETTAMVREVDMEGMEGESIAELRCRVAALQLQLDDVTAIVRRNEKNTRDLLSSFHFWSLLLLDELRGYKAMVGRGASSEAGQGDALESLADSIGDAVKNRVGGDGVTEPSDDDLEKGRTQKSTERGTAGKPKRVFRDGKWITL